MKANQILLRFTLCAGTLWLAIAQGLAQTKTTTNAAANRPVAISKLPKGCQTGQMRCIGAEARKAAAIRNANRRAKQLHNRRGGN
jgi:hypothetical protein